MPGARCTRGLMCKIVRRDAHEHTGSAETLRHSPRNGFTAYAAISPATNSSCHRHRRIEGLAAPGWADETSADLTPQRVPGPRGFAVRFGAVVLRKRRRSRDQPPCDIGSHRRCRVHRIPSQRS